MIVLVHAPAARGGATARAAVHHRGIGPWHVGCAVDCGGLQEDRILKAVVTQWETVACDKHHIHVVAIIVLRGCSSIVLRGCSSNGSIAWWQCNSGCLCFGCWSCATGKQARYHCILEQLCVVLDLLTHKIVTCSKRQTLSRLAKGSQLEDGDKDGDDMALHFVLTMNGCCI